ncbi:MAG: L-lactate dehydrogenase [Candidatus Angelobacter sp. Gp1-AA117]|nr:MAG: L-lactate dehydrogenase [Candidatus Angelobacter sp. Gp1-AA117]
MNSIHPVKIAVVGAGNVGASFAYTLLLSGLATEIILIDKNRARAAGEVMDLHYAVPFAHQTEIRAGDLRDTAGAAITVICAGLRQKPGQSEMDLLTVTDSARFCYLLGNHFHVDPASVQAYVMGAHGETEFPAWSSANIAGVPIREMCSAHGCNPAVLDELFHQTREANNGMIDYKGSSCYAIAAALTRIAASILRNEKRIFTVSTVLQREYGVSEVALSVPTVMGGSGVERILHVGLSDQEVGQFLACGREVQHGIEEAEFVVQAGMRS